MDGPVSTDDPRTRQGRAVQVAVAIATRHGLRVEEPVILSPHRYNMLDLGNRVL